MPKQLTPAATYQKLLSNIRREMERGIKKTQELLEQQKVLTYLAVGRMINSYLNSYELPRGAIGSFYENLSDDSSINIRTLQQCEQFFRYFPKLKPDKQLSWSHYRFLLVEPDAVKREAWIKRIKKEKMPADQLRLELMPLVKNSGISAVNLKTPVRGKLYTYRILKADDIENFDNPWFVDLGFAGRKEAPKSAGVFDNSHFYTSTKADDRYTLKVTNAKVEELFTYQAKLRRVIDGDTLKVVIDQGFSYWNEQTLRLRGIDAPERDTLAGARAKKWVADELKGLPFIIVKTYKDQSDKYDRYLVDVFYKRGEADPAKVASDGIWLNGRMVEMGIAKVWDE